MIERYDTQTQSFGVYMQHTTAKPRNAAIDGLRVLSIAAILIYHLNLSWLPSGHMGVVIFLVISGYMATTSIARAFGDQDHAHVSHLFKTWGKRILRIAPSVVALVAVVGTLCGVLDHVLLTKMRPDVLPSLGFYLNWSYIFSGVSYFDLVGGTSPLLHLWYLGCDMQFFLAWTLLVTILLAIGKRFARWVALILAIASAVWMAWLYVPGADPSRIYYGTDTRAFSLLLGSWLALAFPLGGQPEVAKRLLVKEKVSGNATPGQTRATVWAHLLGLASIAAIVCAMHYVPADSILWYRGGMFALSLLVVILMATLLAPTTVLGAILGIAPLRVLGQRAFALYLWHYPIFLLMGANKTTTVWWMRLAAVGVSLVAAELSLRLVERPFGHLPRRRETTETNANPPKASGLARAIPFVSALAIAGCGAYTYYALTYIPPAYLVPEDSLVSTGSSAGEAMDVAQAKPKEEAEEEPAEEPTDETAETVEPEEQATEKEPAAPPAEVNVTDSTIVEAAASEVARGVYDPILIGDSVPGDAGDVFVPNGGWETRLPNALIDTYIGRRPDQALDVFKGYLDKNVVGSVVVFACFSNTTPQIPTLEEMVAAAGPDRQVYLVGTVNPDGFQDAANANLQSIADEYENVHYVDWPAVLDGHLHEYLWADDTHLRPEGAKVYVDMVVHAVAQSLVDAGGTAYEPYVDIEEY